MTDSTLQVQCVKLTLQSLQMENEVRDLCMKPSAMEEQLFGNQSSSLRAVLLLGEMVIRTGYFRAN